MTLDLRADLPRIAREADAAVDAWIAATPPEGRPALVVQLSTKVAAAAAGMASPVTNGHESQEAEHWLTPEEAADVAQIPVSRIYQWARSARWASRPTRRCLRISEQGFRRWLGSRRG